ncbi:DeoR/GlpR family DNA-binding transcription regulator [Sphingomonas sp. BIUV-7]|uniref:DeoR/GlpR family DNA-binding transcription regulator n=1 Tax=Sphingomonas natans TaxID=3063330 RepID=A0ABT8YA68_9SPHN|nr:DeoR/GlpR family DNA-binding transcription regulator [Sphingomonas sp. BIUV-7]MDO6415210.1 DeoR/GlpR family DNA-binding transcription regulator [Sphingomonas sp. BIUV-7]
MAIEGADIVALRHARILEIARHAGSVAVETLAVELDVTPQTIRRDLNILAQRSMLSRVHGGAVVTSGVDNLDREARRHVAAPAKAAIGETAAALVPNGSSLFINIGTTTEAIARALVDHRDLLVVTNNLNVIDILADRPTIEVIVAGGKVRASDRAVVGALAMDFIRAFKVDYALIGASAVDADGTLLDFDVDEVRVSQTIISHARTVILGVDQTKFGRPAPVRIADMEAIDHLVTDRMTDAALAAACTAAGVAVHETDRAG